MAVVGGGHNSKIPSQKHPPKTESEFRRSGGSTEVQGYILSVSRVLWEGEGWREKERQADYSVLDLFPLPALLPLLSPL